MLITRLSKYIPSLGTHPPPRVSLHFKQALVETHIIINSFISREIQIIYTNSHKKLFGSFYNSEVLLVYSHIRAQACVHPQSFWHLLHLDDAYTRCPCVDNHTWVNGLATLDKGICHIVILHHHDLCCFKWISWHTLLSGLMKDGHSANDNMWTSRHPSVKFYQI